MAGEGGREEQVKKCVIEFEREGGHRLSEGHDRSSKIASPTAPKKEQSINDVHTEG